MAGLCGKMKITGAQFAINLILINQIADAPNGLETQLPQPFCCFQAHPFFDRSLVCTLPSTNVAPVASRGTPPHAFSIQYHHVIAFFSQVKRGGKSRVSATDDADIGFNIAL